MGDRNTRGLESILRRNKSMKIIAHRANINGPDPKQENQINAIIKCIECGYDVEIDIRMIENCLYLGHDSPDNIITFDQINSISEHLWIHCKNLTALQYFSEHSNKKYNFFWHDQDKYTLTSKSFIWGYPGSELSSNSVNVMPEWTIKKENLKDLIKEKIYGICTDFPKIIFDSLKMNK